MEKQGMDGRRRFFRSGLLSHFHTPASFKNALVLLILFLIPADMLFSQTEENIEETTQLPLEISTQMSTNAPVANSSWSVFILVNHPVVSEVNVQPPALPANLTLERIRTEARLVPKEVPPASADAAGETEQVPPENERWTRVEFLFTPTRAGSIAIDPFLVTVSGRQARTGIVRVTVREDPRAVRRYDPRFRWVTPVPSVRIGEKGEISVDLTDWDPSRNIPTEFFHGRIPLNAIYEIKQPAETAAGTYRYTITIIPLEGNSIPLPAFTFQEDGVNLSVPAVTVPVLPALSAEVSSDAEAGSMEVDGVHRETEASDIITAHPFPETRGHVLPIIAGEYNRIIARVKALWDEGRRAEALALIRQNERDNLAGLSLIPLRKDMEHVLGMGYTEDEMWRPLKIPILIWVVVGIFILSTALVLFIHGIYRKIEEARGGDEYNSYHKGVTSRSWRGFRTITFLALLVGLILIFLEGGLGSSVMRHFMFQRLNTSGRTAIVEGTYAYRVPDLRGAVNARFTEGQPVLVGEYRGDWCYAEANDGRAGWVPREAVITY